MTNALIWGAVAGGALLLGAIVGLYIPIPRKLTGFIMAFGTGVLIGAASFELMGEVEEKTGYSYVIFGFLIGATLFTLLEMVIIKKGGEKNANGPRKKAKGILGWRFLLDLLWTPSLSL